MDKTNRPAWGKKVLTFLAKFILVSFPLFALWLVVGDYYRLSVIFVAGFFLYALGVPVAGLLMSLDLFSSPIPFISLMIVTRGVKLRQRLSKVLVGLLILLGWHLSATVILYSVSTPGGELTLWEGMVIPSLRTFLYIFNLVLPFALWFYFLGKTRIKKAILE